MPYVGPSCERCAKPYVSESAQVCGECLKDQPKFASARCYSIYADTLKQAILQFKFHGLRRLQRPLAELLFELELPPDIDIIVPVPMTYKALRQRGYNHTALLGQRLAAHTKIPMRQGLLYKKRETEPQALLSRAARLVNLRGAFGATDEVMGKRILLVDDVITTSTTVRECSKTLAKAGAEEVHVIALARTF